jgi:TRAP-type C4-dicarboxylate transport system permease small subunit
LPFAAPAKETRVKKLIVALDNGFVRLVQIGVVILLALITISAFCEVCVRYFLHASLFWSEETARFGFVWAVMLGTALMEREGGHIGLTVIKKIFKNKADGFFDVLVIAFKLLFMIIVFVGGVTLSLKQSRQASPMIGLPMWSIYIAFPLSMFFMIFWNLTALFKLRPQKKESA